MKWGNRGAGFAPFLYKKGRISLICVASKMGFLESMETTGDFLFCEKMESFAKVARGF
jgi:hypothetical protein